MTLLNEKLLNGFLNKLYPVGKTEIFFDNNDHSNYMGFTWQRTAVGKSIVGIDPNDSDFNQIGKTGGSKYLQEHKHSFSVKKTGVMQYDYPAPAGIPWQSNGEMKSADLNISGETANTGTGNSGNLQPYEVFAIWVRIA